MLSGWLLALAAGGVGLEVEKEKEEEVWEVEVNDEEVEVGVDEDVTVGPAVKKKRFSKFTVTYDYLTTKFQPVYPQFTCSFMPQLDNHPQLYPGLSDTKCFK